MRARAVVVWAAIGAAATVVGCATDEASAVRPARGSIGEETFGVLCDRISAQALPEDLTGESFRAVCHRPQGGAFADAVDEAKLPGADSSDNPTAAAIARTHALARIGALVRHRADVITAIDALFPGDAPLASTCGGPPRALSDALTAMLAQMTPAYDDGTVPQATRALGRVMSAIRTDPDAQTALARLDARRGYRPEEVALGALRPLLAYPRLRELLRATSRVIAPDVDPYAVDASGAHVPVPGPAHATLDALDEVASYEMRTAKIDPTPVPMKTSADAKLGIALLSRARTNAELAATLLSAQDPAFAGGPSRYITSRDGRGVARVNAAAGMPAPFVDVDGDGLADVDALGRFVTIGGASAPAPFLAPLAPDGAPRDANGRALASPNGPPLFDTLDTSTTFAAALTRDLTPLLNADPQAKHETIMDALAGGYVVLGPRAAATKTYALRDGAHQVSYDGFRGDLSPVVDLAYAAGQFAADPNADGALAATAWLSRQHEPEIARAIDAALHVKATADAHPEAKLPATSTLWDDLIDVFTQVAQVKDPDGSPGLLDDVLRALADDASSGLGPGIAALLEHRDEYDYNRLDHNGPALNVTSAVVGGAMSAPVDPSKKDRGFDRSLFQRFLQLVHDTKGVSVCNREGAQVKARMDIPVVGGTIDVSIPDSPLVTAFWGKKAFHECEVFKIDDMATFYVKSIVGRSQYVLRDKQLRDGIEFNLGVTKLDASVTATTVHLLEQSSDITGWTPPGGAASQRTGFWTPAGSKLLMTRPEWLNRNLFFPNGSPSSAPKPSRADAFSKALNPDHAGTSVCPVKVIDDPLPPSDPNYTPGGKIRLPQCADGDWLDQRDAHTIFALEQNHMYEALAPLVKPFADRDRADLLVDLLDVLHRHWADADGDPGECRLDANGGACAKDGAVRYEPIVADTMRALLPALREVTKALTASDARFYVPCAARDPKTAACTGAEVSGTRALAFALRGAIDPDEAARRGLLDRHGQRGATRNDGAPIAQVTPVLLLVDALKSIDRAFDDWGAQHPDDADRRTAWRRARSQLVDQLFTATSTGGTWRLRDRAVATIAPIAIDTIRQQLWARCKEWPNAACAWASRDLAQSAADAVSSPLFAHAVDLGDAIRRDPQARIELEKLLAYLVDPQSGSEALASVLATSNDWVQVLDDDADLVPVLRAVGAAMRGTDAGDRGLLDAQLALLTRLTARANGDDGAEDCAREIDPDQVLTRVLEQAVTPTALAGGRVATPLEVITDAIADVNRASPEKSGGPLDGGDWASVASNVSEFLLDQKRGLEQFYAIVRNATRP